MLASVTTGAQQRDNKECKDLTESVFYTCYPLGALAGLTSKSKHNSFCVLSPVSTCTEVSLSSLSTARHSIDPQHAHLCPALPLPGEDAGGGNGDPGVSVLKLHTLTHTHLQAQTTKSDHKQKYPSTNNHKKKHKWVSKLLVLPPSICLMSRAWTSFWRLL